MAFRDPTPEENAAVEQAKTAGRTFSDVPTEEPTADPDKEWGDVLSESISNLKPSALKFGRELKQAVTNPRETVEALSGMFFGLMEKATPSDTPEQQEREAQADLLIGHFKNRYGDLEKFKTALAKDPVGVMADASTLLVPGGAALKGAGTAAKLAKFAKTGQVLAKTGAAAQKVGAAVDPLQATVKPVAKAAVLLIPKSLPSSLYQSAVKLSNVLPQETRQRMIQLALDEKLMPTTKGVDKLRTQINEIGQTVTDLIDEATAKGEKIKVKDLFREFTQLEKDAKLTGLPEKNIKQINNVRRQITEANKKKLTVEQAQQLKQNVYRDLETTYSKVASRPAAVKAQKAVARAAKELIEEIIPEVKGLNARQGARLELIKALEQAANRISNHDILSLRTTTAGTAGAAAGGPGGLASAAAVGMLDFPKVKSKLAIVLNDIKKSNPEFTPSQTVIDLGLTAPARVEQTAEEQ